jgi:hypothetical protein
MAEMGAHPELPLRIAAPTPHIAPGCDAGVVKPGSHGADAVYAIGQLDFGGSSPIEECAITKLTSVIQAPTPHFIIGDRTSVLSPQCHVCHIEQTPYNARHIV